MKHRALAAFALIATACAHDERPAAPSASSVDLATEAPSNNPDFTPPANQVAESNDAGVDVAATRTDTTPTGSANTTASNTTTSSNTTGSSNATGTTSSSTTNTGPNGTNTTTRTANAGPSGASSARPDNSDVNERDRTRSAVTPMDQGESEADRTITQQIRQAVMKDGSLSFTAKNVKIVTLNRKVTLRGPVKSAAERTAIEAAAKKVAGVTSVENQLEIAD